MEASLCWGAGAGGVWGGILSPKEKRSPRAVLYETETVGCDDFNVLRRRHFPVPAQLPKHLPRPLQTLPLQLQLPASAGAFSLHAHVTRPSPPRPHVTQRARPILLPNHVVSVRPAHLGKMAAPSRRALRVWVQFSRKRVGSLLTTVSKPFCSVAASSRTLDAQRLAERLRAQKEEQKTKRVPVSREGRTIAPKRQCAQWFPRRGVRGEGPLRESASKRGPPWWKSRGKRREKSADYGVFLWVGSLAPARLGAKHRAFK